MPPTDSRPPLAAGAETAEAERGGFEPPIAVYPRCRFSKPVRESTEAVTGDDLGQIANSREAGFEAESAEVEVAPACPNARLLTDLDQLACMWPSLPAHIKAAIMALADTGNRLR